MGAEGEVRQIISPLPGDFDQHGSVVDLGVRDRNAEFNVPTAPPASGADQDKLPLGQQLVQSPYGASYIAHCGLVGKLAVALQVHINNVRDLRYLPIRDEAVGGEDHLVRRQILWDRNRDRIATVALGPALQEIKVLTVVGELDVHRRAQLGLQKSQQLANPRHERRLPDQAFEAENHIAGAKVWDRPDSLLNAVMLNDRHKMANLRVVGAAVTQQFQRIYGLKCIGFQIDHVDSLRRVLQHLFHGNVDSEVGLSRRDQHRIVVVYAVNRACSQSRHEADQSVSATDSGRPTELVVTERDA